MKRDESVQETARKSENYVSTSLHFHANAAHNDHDIVLVHDILVQGHGRSADRDCTCHVHVRASAHRRRDVQCIRQTNIRERIIRSLEILIEYQSNIRIFV